MAHWRGRPIAQGPQLLPPCEVVTIRLHHSWKWGGSGAQGNQHLLVVLSVPVKIPELACERHAVRRDERVDPERAIRTTSGLPKERRILRRSRHTGSRDPHGRKPEPKKHFFAQPIAREAVRSGAERRSDPAVGAMHSPVRVLLRTGVCGGTRKGQGGGHRGGWCARTW